MDRTGNDSTDPSAFSIRPAADGDADSVARLWTVAYVEEGEGGRAEPYTAADLSELRRRGDVFVAEASGGEIVGVVALLPPGAPGRAVAADGESELARLAVAPGVRRTGVGRALVELCERRAGQAGAEAVALWSRRYQEAAHRLYESRGYRRAPERDSVDASGHERVVFRLPLSRPLTTRLEG